MPAVLHAGKIKGSRTGMAICQSFGVDVGNLKILKRRIYMVLADNIIHTKKVLREGHHLKHRASLYTNFI